jgi:hypothetical protein
MLDLLLVEDRVFRSSCSGRYSGTVRSGGRDSLVLVDDGGRFTSGNLVHRNLGRGLSGSDTGLGGVRGESFGLVRDRHFVWFETEMKVACEWQE